MERREHRWRTKPMYDKSGEKFGNLTILGFSRYELKKSAAGRKLFWNCICDCGKGKEVENSNLICGSVKSCGCLAKKHIKKVHKGNINKNAAFESVLKQYISGARERDLIFELTIERFRKLTKSNCFYCGSKPKRVRDRNGSHIFKNSKYIYNGVDRLDNRVGYTNENCVACCTDCNIAKGTKSREDFLTWVVSIYNHQQRQKIGDKNPFYNKKHSKKTKDKISKARKGNYKGNQERSVIINEVTYKSVSEAACIFNVCSATVIHRIKSKNTKFKGYKYEDIRIDGYDPEPAIKAPLST